MSDIPPVSRVEMDHTLRLLLLHIPEDCYGDFSSLTLQREGGHTSDVFRFVSAESSLRVMMAGLWGNGRQLVVDRPRLLKTGRSFWSTAAQACWWLLVASWTAPW
jgi:hypothetical protein